jgi:hypothetical protein
MRNDILGFNVYKKWTGVHYTALKQAHDSDRFSIFQELEKR